MSDLGRLDPKKVKKEFEKLLKRIAELEAENSDLHERIRGQAKMIRTDGAVVMAREARNKALDKVAELEAEVARRKRPILDALDGASHDMLVKKLDECDALKAEVARLTIAIQEAIKEEDSTVADDKLKNAIEPGSTTNVVIYPVEEPKPNTEE